jgi:hypothetical protein
LLCQHDGFKNVNLTDSIGEEKSRSTGFSLSAFEFRGTEEKSKEEG